MASTLVPKSPTQQVLWRQIGDQMRQWMSTCHTAGRVWGCTPKIALFGHAQGGPGV